MDSALLVADFDDERRQAADSAADEAVLEELADAHPEDESDDDEAAESVPGGANAVADAVTWDIDVATYNSHDRVQYYLDFFQDRGRERMSIWLTRLPRYEQMIRERLQREAAQRSGVSGADRERLFQHCHEPRQSRGHVAVHEAHR
jgi:hypothetical protein